MKYEFFKSKPEDLQQKRQEALAIADNLLSAKNWEGWSKELSVYKLRRLIDWSIDSNYCRFTLTETRYLIKILDTEVCAHRKLELNKYKFNDDCTQVRTLYTYHFDNKLLVEQQIEPQFKRWADQNPNPNHSELPKDYLINQKSPTEQWQQLINELKTYQQPLGTQNN